jgi:hypothetical protein
VSAATLNAAFLKLENYMTMTIRNVAQAAHNSSRAIFLEGPPGCGKTVGLTVEMGMLGYEVRVLQGPALQVEEVAVMPYVAPADMSLHWLADHRWNEYSKENFNPKTHKPLCIIVDEWPKIQITAVRNAMLPLTEQRRTIHGIELHPSTRVILTGNIADINAGDKMYPHEISRLIKLSIGNPELENASQIMLDCGYDGRIMQWVTGSAPQALVAWDSDAANRPLAEQGDYWGFNPKDRNAPYSSLRSLECASDTLKKNEGSAILQSLLEGCIGARAARNLTNYILKKGVYVSPDVIWADPHKALLPASQLDQRAVLLGMCGAIRVDVLDQFVTYYNRLHPEVQGLAARMLARRTDAGKYQTNPKIVKILLAGK